MAARRSWKKPARPVCRTGNSKALLRAILDLRELGAGGNGREWATHIVNKLSRKRQLGLHYRAGELGFSGETAIRSIGTIAKGGTRRMLASILALWVLWTATTARRWTSTWLHPQCDMRLLWPNSGTNNTSPLPTAYPGLGVKNLLRLIGIPERRSASAAGSGLVQSGSRVLPPPGEA